MYFLAVAACGRIGFDALSSSTNTDGSTTNGDALAAECSPACKGNEFCVTQVGQCGGVGECAIVVTMCPATFDPMCGCDGVTYDNPCFAQRARASIDYAGTCVPPYVAPCSPACNASEYCALSNCQGPGTCMPRPPIDLQCPDVPACGCDGKMYGNACDARRAGVDVRGGSSCDLM